jgi:hypothetical protein
MQALSFLVDTEAKCLKISRISNFASLLVGRLADTDCSLIPINWDFFRRFAGYPAVLQELLAMPTVSRDLTNVVSSASTSIVSRFLEWSVEIWKSASPEIIVKFCDVVTPSLGRIVSILKARSPVLETGERLARLMEECSTTLLKLDVPGCEKFIASFTKYMATGDQGEDTANKRAKMRRPSQMAPPQSRVSDVI